MQAKIKYEQLDKFNKLQKNSSKDITDNTLANVEIYTFDNDKEPIIKYQISFEFKDKSSNFANKYQKHLDIINKSESLSTVDNIKFKNTIFQHLDQFDFTLILNNEKYTGSYQQVLTKASEKIQDHQLFMIQAIKGPLL